MNSSSYPAGELGSLREILHCACRAVGGHVRAVVLAARSRAGGHGRAGAILALALTATGCAARQPPLPVPPRAAIVLSPADTATVVPPATEPIAGATQVLDGMVALAVTEGEATYYADLFNGRPTASGVIFSNDAPYAAHRTWPFGTVVRVINERNGREVILTVVDRGPHGQARTIIDVSRSAAEDLDFVRQGRTPVRVEVLQWGQGG
jgi:rare lipoprotein A